MALLIPFHVHSVRDILQAFWSWAVSKVANFSAARENFDQTHFGARDKCKMAAVLGVKKEIPVECNLKLR